MGNCEALSDNSSKNIVGNRTEPRTSRSIRFSDSEWQTIDDEANSRGISAAELVRYAALGFAGGRFDENSKPFPPKMVTYIETIYRATYILATLKRNEVLEEGRQEELQEIVDTARKLQDSIRNTAARQP